MYTSTDVTLDPRLLQVHALVPFVRSITASRGDMFASEIGQAPPLKGSEIRRIMTGMEREFGKYTFMVKVPEDSTVIAVINKRSPKGMFGETLTTSKTVILRTVNGRYDVVEIPVHCQNHQQFGFDYVRTQVGQSVYPGQRITKDTILAHSPSLDNAGNYKYGINAKVAFMSIPEVIQDGIVISKSFADKCSFKGYMTATLSFGQDTFPLNIYGDDNEYKIFPDVGDYVKPNGLMFATRRHQPGSELFDMDRYSTRIKEDNDKGTYVPQSEARVIDIEVVHNRSNKTTIPTGMDAQCQRYWASTRDFYRDILAVERQLYKEHGEAYIGLLEGALHNLFVKAHSMLHDNGKSANINFYNGDTILNEWTVTVTVSYDLVPTSRFKAADDSGSKGIVISVWEDEHMPTNDIGEVTDVIMDGGAKINRLILSGLYEQYFNASMNECLRRINRMADEGREEEAKAFLMECYRNISPRQYEATLKRGVDEHFKIARQGPIYLFCPTDNPVYYPDVVKFLEKHCPPHRSPLRYRAGTGQWHVTDTPMIIGECYFIFLEKIGDEYSAVSSPLLQPQGIPGKLSRADKYASPGRPQSTRAGGETEVRIIVSNTDADMAMDMLSSTNSPILHKRQVGAYLTADKPTAIEDVMQFDKYPRHGNNIVDLVKNSLFAGGYCFEVRPVDDN